jgi:hypothetical protein
MKTEKEIRDAIAKVNKDYEHVLTGTKATIQINAPRALMQIDAETKLNTLHWVLGERYKSKLEGVE